MLFYRYVVLNTCIIIICHGRHNELTKEAVEFEYPITVHYIRPPMHIIRIIIIIPFSPQSSTIIIIIRLLRNKLHDFYRL